MPLLSKRERVIWAACFLLVGALIVGTRFASRDPDSGLYAALAERLAALPVAHWIAPYWRALWPGWSDTQLYRDHPVGVFLIPALLDRLGVPAAQAAYVVGVGAGLLSIVLIARLVSRVTNRADARAVLVLLQVMPVAFIFRVRANQEYPMLVCLAVCLLGLEGLRRNWRSSWLVAAGLIGGLLIKGVFVVPILVAAGLWIVIDPPRTAARGRQVAVCLAALLLMAGAIAAYDAAYHRATGELFWGPYWRLQMSAVTVATPIGGAETFARHLLFYCVRLLWHPAPWSLALVWIGWRRVRTPGPDRARLAVGDRRGLWFSAAFVAGLVLMFSVPSRFAERYLFSAFYALGACGAIVAWRSWPRLRSTIDRLDAAIPALPAVLWTVLVLLRIGLGPWIPRIQDH